MNTLHKSTEEAIKKINSYATLSLWEETESSYDFELDVPGFSKPEIAVSTKGTMLSVSITPNEKNKREAFSAEYRLPQIANLGETQATLENGVLFVSVPKKEQEKAKPICIK
jgi:HSP20 family molecular chaperone IbpA